MTIRVLTTFIFFFLLNCVQAESIVFLGDSLTAGYGIKKEDSYPNAVKSFLKEKNVDVDIFNAGVSGSTSASALGRLKWFAKKNPNWLFLALGANDGLRGLKVKQTKENLEKAISFAKKNNIKIVLAGMMMPPNYGAEYTQNFKMMYKKLASEHNLFFMKFLLEGVAAVKKLNQSDGIHPNELGHKKMGENVGQFLYKLMTKKEDANAKN